jgi:metal-sulfur cluster biosynthetic enzyme
MVALSALENVMDPEIGLNVVDLGLIYEINFDEEQKIVRCVMTLTTQFCPMGDAIKENAKYTLEQAFPGYTIDLQLTFEPAWSYDLISEEGRKFLEG